MISTVTTSDKFAVEEIRKAFPALQQHIHNRPLIYFDNAASTQKPASVIAAVNQFYQYDNSNIHRSVHQLSARATAAFENSREQVRKFIRAKSLEEIIFTSGATESINLVAQSYGRNFLKAGDEIIVSQMEHHSN